MHKCFSRLLSVIPDGDGCKMSSRFLEIFSFLNVPRLLCDEKKSSYHGAEPRQDAFTVCINPTTLVLRRL